MTHSVETDAELTPRSSATRGRLTVPSADAAAQLLQSVVELDRGLKVLEKELALWARINTVHGKRALAETLGMLRTIAEIQDRLLQVVLAP